MAGERLQQADVVERGMLVGHVHGADGRLLKTLGLVHDVEFGLQTFVARGGTARIGDAARLL